MKIEKIYFINLNDKKNRWESVKNIDSRMERFDAIDSRTSFSVCQKFNLSLNPVGLVSQLYFSMSTGAVGVYCSHYSIWNDIIKNNIKYALILEDDINLDDLKCFLSEYSHFENTFDFLQLNKRRHRKKHWWKNFDGLESYVLTTDGAKKLVETTHNRDHFNQVISHTPCTMGLRKSPHCTMDIFQNEFQQDWTTKMTISCAVDKFVGFCANPNLNFNKKVNVRFLKKIGLSDESLTSDINSKDWRKLSENEIEKYISSSQFKYWEKI